MDNAKSLNKKVKPELHTDLKKNGSLKKPVRHIRFTVAGYHCRLSRGADNHIPDEIVMIGGIFINLRDGRIGKSIASVNGGYNYKN
jgi:hypothetical protein